MLAAVAIWSGANTYIALTQKTRVEVPEETTPGSSAEPEIRYEYETAPLNRRIPQALGTILLGVGLSGVVIVLSARTAKRLHLLVPRKGSSETTMIMIENVMHGQGAGRVFDINRCTFNRGKSSSDLFLRVDGIKGQWACYTDRVMIPNLVVAPNLAKEETRVASELCKVLWDYRTQRTGLAVPEGKKSAEGLYHNFPWEPTIPASESSFFKEAKEASKPPETIEALGGPLLEATAEEPPAKINFFEEAGTAVKSEPAQPTQAKKKASTRKAKRKDTYIDKSTSKLEKALQSRLK